VFRDFNFDKDRAAAREIAAMNLPLTLIPYEGARSVRLTGADLARLDAAGGAAAWVARRARGWMKFWANVVGLDGFYPFDALAAAYAIEPMLFNCADAAVWVAKDARRRRGRDGLLIGPKGASIDKAQAAGSAHYCSQLSSAMRDWLMARLIHAASPAPAAQRLE
jgi:inosine-uridine nucleoside N-ribohydrolase